MKICKKTILTVLITFLVTLAVLAVSIVIFLSRCELPFEKLIKVMNIIESSYVGNYDKKEMEEAAINGMLESIEDKYALYYNGENAEKAMQMLEGHYIGIGVEVYANTKKGYMEVISAYADSPADRAGIKSGDLIKVIDGKEYLASDMADATTYMKGPGTKESLETPMEIVILRGEEEITVKLNREIINMYKVTSQVTDGICYIRYSGYTEESQREFEKIVEGLDKNIYGIVVDLRNNPGGEFNSAVKMCDLFLDDELIMYTTDKSGKKTKYYADSKCSNIPLSVIVNGSTASAAEIFAGSMQANGRAVIVGEKTYGKGVSQTVQYINPLDRSEGALKLTTCKNYTPDGKWINEGIKPDIPVKTTQIEEDITTDAAFIAAVNSLKKGK